MAYFKGETKGHKTTFLTLTSRSTACPTSSVPSRSLRHPAGSAADLCRASPEGTASGGRPGCPGRRGPAAAEWTKRRPDKRRRARGCWRRIPLCGSGRPPEPSRPSAVPRPRTGGRYCTRCSPRIYRLSPGSQNKCLKRLIK